MELFQNLALGKFTRSIGLPAVVTAATVKARDTVPLDAKFHDGLALSDMGEDLMLVFVIKDGFADDSETLALASAWTEIAAGHYRANLSLNTAELIAAVGTAGSIKVFGELSWSRDAGDTWASSPTLAITVENDVYKGTEGTPLALPGPVDWLAQHGIVHDPAITGLTGGGATKLDGISHVGSAAGRLQAVSSAGFLSLYRLVAGDLEEEFPTTINADSAPDAWSWVLESMRAFSIVAENVDASLITTPELRLHQAGDFETYAGFSVAALTGVRTVSVPDRTGTMAMEVDIGAAAAGGGMADVAGVQELVLWNSTQAIYQILRLSGGPGAETIEISNIP
jgi:hypothetical protein